MADKFWSGNLGATMPSAITKTGVTTAGACYEFRLTYTASGVTKRDALDALEAIKSAITSDSWPPV